MSRIKPSGDLAHIKLHRAETAELFRSDNVRYWLRYIPHVGIALVQCWLPSDPKEPAETCVEIIIGEHHYRQWYKHAIVTERAAALLVNRFLADIQAAQHEMRP